jgi:hypothetical protein
MAAHVPIGGPTHARGGVLARGAIDNGAAVGQRAEDADKDD